MVASDLTVYQYLALSHTSKVFHKVDLLKRPYQFQNNFKQKDFFLNLFASKDLKESKKFWMSKQTIKVIHVIMHYHPNGMRG
jgi:hypothetical protein